MTRQFKMLAIIYLAAIAAPINFYKVPPVMINLMDSFNISVATSGWLMTVFAIIGTIFAIPVGQLAQRFGLKQTIMTALVSLICGGVMGLLSDSLALLLISRIIEGMGLCLLSIAGAASIVAWFPDKNRSIAMGIWATWVPFGTFVVYLLPLSTWQLLWIVALVYTAILLFVVLLFFKMPDGYVANTKEKLDTSAVYRNKQLWTLALIFMLFNMMSIALKSYMPLFLASERGLSTVLTSYVSNIIMLCSLVGGTLGGVILARVNSFKLLYIGSFAYAIVLSLVFNFQIAGIVISLVFCGILLGVIPASVFFTAPTLLSDQKLAGIGMSIITLGQNIGMVLGPIVFSYTISAAGWTAGGLLIGGYMAVAGVIAIILSRQ